MNTDRDDIRLIEELAANAWPALVVQVIDGWIVRFTPGVRARRSSSVLPNEGHGRVALEDRLALVEAFYSRRAVPVRYQVSPAAVPGDLDAVLEARGYDVEAPVQVRIAELDGVSNEDSWRWRVRVSEQVEAGWLEAWTAVFQRGDAATTRRRVLDRIAPPAGFASLAIAGRVAAVGMGVAERGWLGIYGMATLPEFRRRGAARAVLGALARWGRTQGATRAYLQVVEENEAAVALYAPAGFQPAYGYHYRTKGARG